MSRQISAAPLVVLVVLTALVLAACGEHAPSGSESRDAHGHVEDEVWTCPMHPQVRQDHAGKCPICGMQLVRIDPAAQGSDTPAAADVVVHAASQALAHIDLAPAHRGPLVVSVRAPGRVGFDETRVFDVTLRVSGYIERLFIDAEGSPVEKGAPLAWLDSPQLVQAQQELLRATSGGDAVAAGARQRLVVFGMSDGQIDDVIANKTVLDPVPILAGQGGVVVAKDVVAGQYVDPGQRLVRLARLDKVWVEADVFPDDAAQLHTGQPAHTQLVGSSSAPLAGKVARILPTQGTDARASTIKVRIDVDNAGRALVPGASVVVLIEAQHKDALLVPRDSVIPTGARFVVFVAPPAASTSSPPEQFMLREVEVGEHSVDEVEIRAGLVEGERVVRRGAFLVAAESRLRAPAQWSGPAPEPPVPNDGGAP